MILRVYGDGENNRRFEIVVDKAGLEALKEWLKAVEEAQEKVSEQRHIYYPV